MTKPLDATTRAAIKEGQAQARRGEFADDALISRLFEPQNQPGRPIPGPVAGEQ